MIRTPAFFWAVLLYSFILGHFLALFLVVLLYIFIPNNSALFPAVLLYSSIPGHVTFQHYSRPFQVLFPTVFEYLWVIALIIIKVSYDNTGIVYASI